MLSQRGPTGWSSEDLALAHRAATGKGIGTGPEYHFFSTDLESVLVQPFGRFEAALSSAASEQTPYRRALGACESDCFTPLVSGAPGHENVPAGTRFGEEALCEEENEFAQLVESTCGPEALDASPDLSHVVLASKAPLNAGAPREELYEWSEGALQLISALPRNGAGEELPAPPSKATFGGVSSNLKVAGGNGNSRRALSADGARVFWEETGGEGALYVRDTTLRQTLQLDSADPACKGCESGGGHFQIASADGARVFFSDKRRLSEDAGAGLENVTGEGYENPDLYECRIEVRGGRLACGQEGPIDITPRLSGKSANVQGAVLGSGENGEELYFIALGTLGAGPNARGQSAVSGQPNLFVRAGGQSRFVATLRRGDQADWHGNPSRLPVRVSPSGRWLSLMSEARLTGYDNRDAVSGRADAEIYLYDASVNQIQCASCDPTGARPLGVEYGTLTSGKDETTVTGLRVDEWEPSGWVSALAPITTELTLNQSAYQARYLNDQGRLFFNSLDALSPGDVNGNWDVYEHEPAGLGGCGPGAGGYQAGSESCLGLVSSGTSAQQSAFMDASESGDDAFFITTAKLSSADFDNSFDVYDAHVCSGASPCIAPTPALRQCETEASCKAAPAPQPGIFGAPPSATFNGAGNLSPLSAVKVKALTRAQKLAAALRACEKDRKKAKRTKCQASARKQYGVAKKQVKKSTSRKGSR